MLNTHYTDFDMEIAIKGNLDLTPQYTSHGRIFELNSCRAMEFTSVLLSNDGYQTYFDD